MANDMQHGVACSIYMPARRIVSVTAFQQGVHPRFEHLLRQLPAFTTQQSAGRWTDPSGVAHEDDNVVLTCVVNSFGEVADTFRAIAAFLKDQGEQQVFITVQPISFILE